MEEEDLDLDIFKDDIIENFYEISLTKGEKLLIVFNEENDIISLKQHMQSIQLSLQNFNLAQDRLENTLVRGGSQQQGSWGEFVLKNILDGVGLREGYEYETQKAFRDQDGNLQKPDVIIHMPGKRDIIIDSKVSLKAYNEFVNTDDEVVSKASMERLCLSIRKHASELSNKNYQHMESIQTLDFVLMVVPLESAYIAALHHDPSLYNDMIGNRRVKIVSGTTIMLALILIQELWKRENQSKNQIQLVERAGALHDQVVLFLESFTAVGFEIKQASEKFEEAEKRLVEGKGNVLRQTEMLSRLGAKNKKDLREKSGLRKLAEQAELSKEEE